MSRTCSQEGLLLLVTPFLVVLIYATVTAGSYSLSWCDLKERG
jgi:hypothetical protein